MTSPNLTCARYQVSDRALRYIEMRPGWALMLEPDRPLLPEWDATFVNHGRLSWTASQVLKPGRPENHVCVLHAGPGWSAAHLEKHAESTCELLVHAGRELPSTQAFGLRQAHRAELHFQILRDHGLDKDMNPVVRPVEGLGVPAIQNGMEDMFAIEMAVGDKLVTLSLFDSLAPARALAEKVLAKMN